MDEDGEGTDDVVISGISDDEVMGSVMGTVGEDSSDSVESVLQSMGYSNSEAGMDRVDWDSTDSWTSALQTVIILAVVGFVGVTLVYFLITGLLAIFGVHL